MNTESSDRGPGFQGSKPVAKQRPPELRVALMTLVLPLYISVGFAASYIGARTETAPRQGGDRRRARRDRAARTRPIGQGPRRGTFRS